MPWNAGGIDFMAYKSCKKIAWYCPFTLPPLLQVKNADIVQIKWSENQNSLFGNVKLCKKMSALLEMVESTGINGLVMPDCCSTSCSVCSFLEYEYPDLQIYRIHIPRKVDDFFFQSLLSQWNKLYADLCSSSQSEMRDAKANFILYKEAGRFFGADKDYSSYVTQENPWCCLSEGVEIIGTHFYKTMGTLLTSVRCPRLLLGDGITTSRLQVPQKTSLTDSWCILQGYYSCTVEAL